jgi:hypothetical protein
MFDKMLSIATGAFGSTTTCSICLSKLKMKRTKLMCGHLFHEKCISQILKPQCPLCEHPIPTVLEKRLLNSNDDEEIERILKTADYDVKIVFENVVGRNGKFWKKKSSEKLVSKMCEMCDMTDVLANYMCDEIIAKHLIQNCKRINWFRTFNGGLTFQDIAARTGCIDLMKMVREKLPLEDDEQIFEEVDLSQPPRPLPTPPVPPRNLKKPKREEIYEEIYEIMHPVVYTRMNEIKYPVLPSAPSYEELLG